MSEKAKMQVTALAPWFGGKRSMAPEIVQELGPHSAYWEPFCGSMAVLFAKPQSSHETVNDYHGNLINLAMVVASEHWKELYDRLCRTFSSEALFKSAKQQFMSEKGWDPPTSPDHVRPEDVRRAFYYFVVSWMGRNGVSGTYRTNYQMAIRWTPGGGDSPTRFRGATDSMPLWHARLRNVLILNRDGFNIIDKIDDVERVVIYADPPYLRSTRSMEGRTGNKYLYDFADQEHGELAAKLRRFRKARVIVSYYDDPRLKDLYPGWTIRKMYRHKNLHVQNRRGAERCLAPEVLLINGPSYATDDDGGLFAAEGVKE